MADISLSTAEEEARGTKQGWLLPCWVTVCMTLVKSRAKLLSYRLHRPPLAAQTTKGLRMFSKLFPFPRSPPLSPDLPYTGPGCRLSSSPSGCCPCVGAQRWQRRGERVGRARAEPRAWVWVHSEVDGRLHRLLLQAGQGGAGVALCRKTLGERKPLGRASGCSSAPGGGSVLWPFHGAALAMTLTALTLGTDPVWWFTDSALDVSVQFVFCNTTLAENPKPHQVMA